MWRVKVQKLRRFSAQEHDKYMTITSVFYCGIFHLQNTFQCTCIRYNLVLYAAFFSLMFWVLHFINQDSTTAFCIIRKYVLFCKTFKIAPAQRAHWSTVRAGFAPGNTPVRHLLVREGDMYKTPTFVGSCDRLRLRGCESLGRYSLIELPPWYN